MHFRKLQREQKLAERRDKRKKAIAELIKTEETYVRLLLKLKESYIDSESMSKIISQTDHQLIFGNLPTIINLNANFLETLQTEFKAFDNEKSQFGEFLLKFSPYFKLYQKFSKNFYFIFCLLFVCFCAILYICVVLVLYSFRR